MGERRREKERGDEYKRNDRRDEYGKVFEGWI